MKPILIFHYKDAKVIVDFDDDFNSSDLDEQDKDNLERGNLSPYLITIEKFDKSGYISGEDCIAGVLVYAWDDFEASIKVVIDDYNMIDAAEKELQIKLNDIFEANFRKTDHI